MHQRQPAHKQVSALRYYSHERETSFTRMWGGEGRGGKKKGHHAELKEAKANLFSKCTTKVLKERKYFVICDYFPPTLPKGLSAQLPLTMYRCDCTSAMLFMVLICNTFTYGKCNFTTPSMTECTWGAQKLKWPAQTRSHFASTSPTV